jgi:hypothetical protein
LISQSRGLGDVYKRQITSKTYKVDTPTASEKRIYSA